MRPIEIRPIAAASVAFLLLIGPARAATILHLSATATVQVVPDQLDAELAAEVTAASPVAAQNDVNAMIGKALKSARAVSVVTASTGTYSVWYVTDPRAAWQARQTLVLRAHDGASLLGLVGQLQDQGLAVSSLGWQLAAETARKAREQAQAIALAQLKGRAEAAAKVLGLSFAGFREVWLNPPSPSPIQPMMLMQARGAPPNAVPAETSVAATVEAAVTLEGEPRH
ncbi:MAG TPA: SIMPL domain-containing protein [Acetobacteraceae bacterium]|nr:SIMPL domain-containing protein [Acetobacteraceae bacterium]